MEPADGAESGIHPLAHAQAHKPRAPSHGLERSAETHSHRQRSNGPTSSEPRIRKLCSNSFAQACKPRAHELRATDSEGLQPLSRTGTQAKGPRATGAMSSEIRIRELCNHSRAQKQHREPYQPKSLGNLWRTYGKPMESPRKKTYRNFWNAQGIRIAFRTWKASTGLRELSNTPLKNSSGTEKLSISVVF